MNNKYKKKTYKVGTGNLDCHWNIGYIMDKNSFLSQQNISKSYENVLTYGNSKIFYIRLELNVHISSKRGCVFIHPELAAKLTSLFRIGFTAGSNFLGDHMSIPSQPFINLIVLTQHKIIFQRSRNWIFIFRAEYLTVLIMHLFRIL